MMLLRRAHDPVSRWFGVVLALALSSCDLLTDVECTLIAAVGIQVEVVDAGTGAVVDGASVSIRDDAYTESLVPTPNGFFIEATERAGVYEVTVSKAGYEAWGQSDVRVDSDECHVQTVLLRAELTPSAGGAARSSAHGSP